MVYHRCLAAKDLILEPLPGGRIEHLPRAEDPLDMAQIEGFANERLAGYKRPRSWEFRDELPRTESGKLLKRVLRDEHWKDRTTGV